MNALRLYWKYNWHLWAVIALCAGGLLYLEHGKPVAASGGSDNACVEIGTAGPRTIYYCVNPQNGQELYVNDAGFIEVVE